MRRGRAWRLGLAAAALLGLAAPAQAAPSTGQITGTVTDLVTQAPLSSVEVLVYDTNHSFVVASSTNSSGVYSIPALAPSAYELEFSDYGDQAHLAQYFNDKATLATADPVTVTAGATTAGIDAALARAGRITGTVSDPVTHTPVPGVYVQVLDATGNDVGDTTTDISGRYSVGRLASGTYRVAFHPSYGQPYGNQYYADRPTLAQADAVIVTSGQPTTGIDAHLVAAARIQGTVTDAASGAAVAGAEVDVLAPDGTAVTATETDAHGHYVVGGLVTGGYKLRFSAANASGNYAPEFYNAKPTAATADAMTTTAGQVATANAALSAGGQIEGTATDAQTGQPVPSVSVTALDSSGNPVGYASTAADGSFTLGSLGGGSYTVLFTVADNKHLPIYYNGAATASAASPVSVTVGAPHKGIDAALPLGAGITGTVTDATGGVPIAGASVSAIDASGASDGATSTGADGTYSLGGLQTGSYRIRFEGGYQQQAYTGQYYQGAATLAGATPVSATVGHTSGHVDAALSGGGSVDGTVTDQATGSAIANAQVTISSADGHSGATGQTDSAGHFFAGGLTAGSYVARFDDPSGNHLTQFYNGRSTGPGDPFQITVGQTTHAVNAALAAAGRIAGTVTDAVTHQPIAGVQVTATGDDGGQSSAITATDGTYAVGGLAADVYTVAFADNGQGKYVTQYYNARASIGAADEVTVTAGQTSSAIDAALATGGQISGIVTDAHTSNPVPGTYVTVYDASGAFVASSYTASDGRYTVGGLTGGSYRVGFSPTSGSYYRSFYSGKSTLAAADPVSVTVGQITPNVNAALKGNSGAIAGTISDGQLSAPLPNASVTVYDQSDNYAGLANTDANGQYTVAGLPTGRYHVQFEANGYGVQYYNGKPNLRAGDTVAVTNGQTTAAIDATLKRQGLIEGTVTGAADGTPAANVTVAILDSFGDWYTSTTTGADGTYAVGGLTAGSYRVEFLPTSGENYLPEYYGGQNLSTATSVAVSDGTVVQGINAQLPAGGQITGTVTSASDGAPLANTTVFAAGQSGAGYGTAVTDATGQYTIAGLTSDSYTVTFVSPDASHLNQGYANNPVSVSVGQTTPNINAALGGAAELAGTVTDAGTHVQVAGVLVSVYNAAGSSVGSADTDPNGQYTIGNLPSGSYRVGFSNDYGAGDYITQYYNDKATLATADPVSATAGQTTGGIDAALQQAATIAGTVTDATTHATVPYASVYAYDASGTFVTETSTDGHGAYAIGGLATGSYRIEVDGFGRYIAQFYNGKSSRATADPVSVTAGSTTANVNFVLQNGAGITGRVTDGSGQAISGATIYISGPTFQTATTDASGNYAVAGLSTGSYHAEFVARGYLVDYYNNRADANSADPVAVTSGQNLSGINAVMQSAGNLTGTVADANGGQPIAGEPVFALTLAGQTVTSTSTDARGHYTLIGLPTGSYQIGFGIYGVGPNYVPTYFGGQQCAATSPTRSQYSVIQSQYSSGLTCTPGSVGASAVPVTAGQTVAGINAALFGGSQLTGTVTDADTQGPLALTAVTVYDASGELIGQTTAADNGGYTLDALPAADYKVGFSGGGNGNAGYLPQYYHGRASLAAADTVSVGADRTATGIDAAMQFGGQITGTVTDAAAQQPVSNVRVMVFDATGTFVRSTFTSYDGGYAITGLTTGSYRIRFSPLTGGYMGQYYSGESSLASADAVAVTVGNTTQGIDAALTRPGSISGTVTDATTHAAVWFVPVYAYDASGNFVTSTSTAGDGTYTIAGLTTGSYRIEVAGAGQYIAQYYNGKTTLATADPIGVRVGSTTANINVLLQNAGGVTGTVTDSGGHPLSGATVYVSGPSFQSATSDANGNYAVSGLTTGSYKVEFSDPGKYVAQYYNNQATLANANAVSVTAGQTTSAINAALQVGGSVSGTITDANTTQPIAGASVDVFQNGGFVASTATGASGNYTIAGLATGSYTVYAYGTGYVATYYNGGGSVSVTSGQSTGSINIALVPAGAISGTVTAQTGGAAIAGVQVWAYPQGAGAYGYAYTNGSGAYTIANLAPGSYKLEFSPPFGQNYMTQYYNGQSTLAAANTVTVSSGQATTGIDVALASGAQIQGTVTVVGSGAAVSGEQVELYGSNGNQIQGVTSGAGGAYDFAGLAAGTYKVGFVGCYGCSSTYITQFYSDQSNLAGANAITLAAGQTQTGVSAQLQPAGQISGTVTDAATGQPAVGVEVMILNSSGGWAAYAYTGSNGTYTAGGLTSGTYTAEFSESGRYFTQYYNGQTSAGAATAISVTVGTTTAGIDAAMQTGGTIAGTVTDAGTGQSISGAWVSIYSYSSSCGYCYYVGAASTNSAGHYSYSGLNGSYTVEFNASGYQIATYDNGATISVPYGQIVNGVNGALTQTGSITGTVTDASTSQPISGASVDVYNANGSYAGATTTGSGGTYAVTSLPAGNYKVEFTGGVGHSYVPQYYNGQSSLQSATTVAISSGGSATGINAALQPGAQIQGTVTAVNGGAAVAGEYVQVSTTSGGYVANTYTDSSGNYSVSGLAAGSYDVQFRTTDETRNYLPQYYNGQSTLQSANAVTLTTAQTQTAVNASLQPGGQITGHVTSAATGKPIAGVDVRASGSSQESFATTDSNGNYTLNSLQTDSVTVSFNDPTGLHQNATYAQTVAVTASQATPGINQTMTAASVITGGVNDAISNNPLQGATVTLYDGSGNQLATAQTDSGGGYSFSRLVPGSYKVGFTDGSTYGTQYYNTKTSLASADTVTAAGEQNSSAVNGRLTPLPVEQTPPSITGVAQQGQTVTEYHGTWTNSPTSYSSQWLDCNSSGANCTPISGATSQTYTATATDVGFTLEVQETAINAGGSSLQTGVAAPTAVVIPVPPVNTTPPSISGTAQQGKTLTETHGVWTNKPTSYGYQWERCDSFGANCQPISGAISQTYIPVPTDVGNTLVVSETASNAGGTSSPTASRPTAVVVAPIPTSITAPTIIGTAQQSQTLTEQNGTWTYSPTSYGYQWLDCNSSGSGCTPISGATSQTYTATASDVGSTIEVQETATNAGGTSAPAGSRPTAVVIPAPPVNTAPPTISGTAQQGQTLIEAHGDWMNNPTGYGFQWLQCDSTGAGCTPITGANAQTYVPVAADVGHTLVAQETASNSGGAGTPADSAPTQVVVPPTPTNTTPPTIAGTAQQGQTLTAQRGSWTSSPTSYAYEWERCDSTGANCQAISGATDQSYVPVADDVGNTLEVQETASNSGGAGTPATSQPTAAIIGDVPHNTLPPTITGTAQDGNQLTVQHGWWMNQPTSYSYQWLLCEAGGSTCTPINGATSASYAVTTTDVGGTLEVSEMAINATGDGQPTTSAATSVVLPAVPTNQTPPTITGTADQRQTLTERHGTWTNSPTSYRYQWQRCDTTGTNCQPIAGATDLSYTPTGDDVGGTLVVEEFASNSGGESDPTGSAATAVVTGEVPQNASAPTISGTAQDGRALNAQQGTWTNQPTSYSYQWLVCDTTGANCQPIGGATDPKYQVGTADVGQTIVVQETAANATGAGQPAQSQATATVIPPAPANTVPPTITGKAQQGATLTAHQGMWSNSPMSYSYQWLRCDSGGANCQPIGGATATTYVITAAAVSDTIAVQETASGAGSAGSPATSAATAVVGAANPPSTSLALSSTTTVAPADLTATIGGTDPDGRALTYTLDFGDGSSTVTGSLPAAPVQHTYKNAGDYVVRLSVNDGVLTDVKTENVTVALSAPLAANAGDDQVATVDTAAHFDASATTPTAGIENYHWDFGDGSSGDGEAVDHTYANVGNYTATLTVSAAGQTSTDTAKITVNPAPVTPGLQVNVTDKSGNPLGGAALVVIDAAGNRYSAETDSTGTGSLQGLADGSYAVYVWKGGSPGYLPATTTATVANDHGSATVTLKSGQLATTSLTSTPLTRDQIVAAGIDPNDPKNQNVYKFEVHLAFTPFGDVSFSGYAAGGGGGGGGGGEIYDFGSGGGGQSCLPYCIYTQGGYSAVVSVQWFDNQPELLWLVIPGEAKWLKEFFSVQMMVTNLAEPNFVLDHGSATLPLPAGLSLAPTPTPQQATVPMPDIPGGQSATSTWLVRGDAEGYYPLSASYGGVLEPFGAAVQLDAQLQTPLHVWGGSALQMIVDTDAKVYNGYPYRVRVGLRNVADVPVYNPEVDLAQNGRTNYIYQPQERLNQGTAEVDPGQTFWTDYYRLVPEISGSLDLTDSFVKKTGGNADVASTIESHPAVPLAAAPRLIATNLKNEVGFQWDQVPGATDYRIFETSSPDTPFPDQPLSYDKLPSSDGMLKAVVRKNIPAGTKAYFAVSSIINGKPTMMHPLVYGESLDKSPTPTVSVQIDDGTNSSHTCGATSVPVTFTFRDSFFGLKHYHVQGGDITTDSDVSGTSVTVATTIHLTPGQETPISAYAVNTDSNTGSATGPEPAWNAQFDTRCVAVPAVVVAAGLNSDLNPTLSDTPNLSPDCSSGKRQFPPNTDGFDQMMATNACDAEGVANGNLVSYLESKGYKPGATRSSPNRTLLEFSYNGADVNCYGQGGPTFIPNGYSSKDTYRDLVTNLSVDSTHTANGYVDALKQYSDCWKDRYGTPLVFTVVGHSEGGYNAFAIARAAEEKRYTGLIAGVVSVDGAMQPPQVLSELNAGGCLFDTGILHIPADIAGWFNQTKQRPAALLDNEFITDTVAQQIYAVKAFGTRVATVTNADDPCLYEDATLNNAAETSSPRGWDINYLSGGEEHNATLNLHGPDVNAYSSSEPGPLQGFPLAQFLDNNFVHSASSTSLRAAWTQQAKPEFVSATPVSSSAPDVTLTATMTTPDGLPVTDGIAALVDANGREVAIAKSDSTGQAPLTAPIGTYTLEAGSPGTAVDSQTVDLSTTTTVALQLTPAAVVRVGVKDQDGQPLAGVLAAVYSGSTVVAAGFTGSDGVYTATGLEAGSYTIKLYEALGRFTLPDVAIPVTTAVADPGSGSTDYTVSLQTPSNTAPPTITGTTAEQRTLSEGHGNWANYPTVFSYQWERCDAQGSNCQSIAGATSQAYALNSADVGSTIRVRETAENAGGSSPPATSDPTSVIVSPPPASITPPTVSGTATQGQTLAETDGRWANGPTSFSYRWEDCDSSGNNCQAITGATSQTYALTGTDVGSTIVVTETATNAGGSSGPVASSATQVVLPLAPVNSQPPPTISGTAQQGQTLTEAHGGWSSSLTSYSYQWEDCDSNGANCAAIAAATGQTYTLTLADAGSTIRVQETTSNAGGNGSPATSTQTAVVLPLAPASTSVPAISGNTTQRQTLSESHGGWSNNPTGYSYRWEDCDSAGNSCSAISGATSQTYTLTGADAGHTIRVQETASNAGGNGSPASSAATGVVQSSALPPSGPVKPSNSAAPVISGTATVGQTVSASSGAWSGIAPVSYSYQWARCNPGCSNIAGATSGSYTLTSADLGAKIDVVVTATNSAGNATATSSEVGPVVAAAPSVAQVKAALSKMLKPSGKAAKLKAIVKAGGYSFSFTAPSAGTLVLDWFASVKGKQVLVASTSVAFHAAGKATVKLSLTGKGRKLLKAGKSVKITIKATFTPTGGTSSTTTKTTILKP